MLAAAKRTVRLGVYAFEHITGLTEAFGSGRGVGAGAVALVEAATSRALPVIRDGPRTWLTKASRNALIKRRMRVRFGACL